MRDACRMDSRSTLRFPLDLHGALAIDGSDGDVPCRVRNVSLGGVFVIGPHLTIGARAVVRFGGPGLSTIESPCIARWHDATGTGLQFEGLRAAETYALSKFLRAATRPTSLPAARSSEDPRP
jgi:hypothetical protein